MNVCDICKKNNVSVHTTTPYGKSMQLCWECNNKLAAGYLGIKLIPFDNGVYEYSGIRGKKHKFMINQMVHPMGISFEAREITGDNISGFQVEVTDDLDCDQLALLHKLEAKIKKAILKRYLKNTTTPYGKKNLTMKNDEVAGRLVYDENNGIQKVIIDGKIFTWEQLGNMLDPYEGFQFKLKIYDMTDDIE